METEHHKKIAVRKQLIQAKRLFDEYIEALSDIDWKRQFKSTHFTIGEIMMQNTASLEFIPQVIGDILKGKSFSGPPKFVIPIVTKFVQFFFGGFIGRDLTRPEIKKRYARAHRRVMEMIEDLSHDAWDKKTMIFEKEMKIDDVFTSYLNALYQDLSDIYTLLTQTTH